MASEAEGCWFEPSQSHHLSPNSFLIYCLAVSYGIYGGVLWPCAGLPSSVRSRSGQRCSPSINGRLARPCDRSAYTYTPSGRSPALLVSFSRVPLGKAPTVTALGTSGRVRRGARGLGLTPAPCAAAPVVFAAIRAAMLRRRDTVSSPCDVSRCASDEPRRCMSLSSALDLSSLPHLPLRRVFLRSFCARRRSVSELSLPTAADLPRHQSRCA